MKSIRIRVWDGKEYRIFPEIRQWDIEDYELFSKLTRENEPELHTGFKDKNGNDVWECDILDFDPNEWGCEMSSVVGWNAKNGEWCFGGGCSSDVSKWRQVIGNTHENSNLLNP